MEQLWSPGFPGGTWGRREGTGLGVCVCVCVTIASTKMEVGHHWQQGGGPRKEDL